jgi:hypothetical protein
MQISLKTENGKLLLHRHSWENSAIRAVKSSASLKNKLKTTKFKGFNYLIF